MESQTSLYTQNSDLFKNLKVTTLHTDYEASQSDSSSFSLPLPYPLPPTRIIKTSLPFATYNKQPSSHQPLNPVQHPPSCTYHYIQAPHISPFQVIQTRESIPQETEVVVQIEITPDSTRRTRSQCFLEFVLQI